MLHGALLVLEITYIKQLALVVRDERLILNNVQSITDAPALPALVRRHTCIEKVEQAPSLQLRLS